MKQSDDELVSGAAAELIAAATTALAQGRDREAVRCLRRALLLLAPEGDR